MFKALNQPIINEPKYINRFYLVYITNLSKTERKNIIDKLSKKEYFVGACDMTFTSLFKTYVSHCINTTFIQLEKNIIMGHESDLEENSDRNMYGLPFEENGYQITSIQGDYFSQFLSYAIDSDLIIDSKGQEKYLKLLSNVITSQEKSLDKFQIKIEHNKIIYLEKNKKILSRLKIKEKDLDKLLLEKIKNANIYNISFNYQEKYGKVKFNIFFDYNTIFTKDKPIIFAFHGYPSLINKLTYTRVNQNMHIAGYDEEGTITTPFDMRVQNKMDRYNLVLEALKRLTVLGNRSSTLAQYCRNKLVEHKQYIHEHGEDMPEIKNWKWDL